MSTPIIDQFAEINKRLKELEEEKKKQINQDQFEFDLEPEDAPLPESHITYSDFMG